MPLRRDAGFGWRQTNRASWSIDCRCTSLKLTSSGIVLKMLRGIDGLARVKAIQKVARQAGIRTVAECVESDVIRAALMRLGIDFAQGFGIAKPR